MAKESGIGRAARCLICLEPEPPAGFTLEHIFPESVGGTLTIQQVCKPCNDKLGHSVDCTVTDHTLVQLARMNLGIAGKSGHIPNPVERGHLADNPQYKFSLRADPLGQEPLKPYVVASVIKTIVGPREGLLSVRLDAEDAHLLGEVINKALTRAGAPPLTPEQIAKLSQTTEEIYQPTVNVQMSLDVGEYRRGLVKIVYELACLWLGNDYLDDPIAAELRRFMLDAALPLNAPDYRIRGTTQFAGRPLMLPFWEESRVSLIAASFPQGNALGIYVNVLGALEALVRVTDDLSAYPGFDTRFVSIDPTTGAMRHTSLDREIIRIGSTWQPASA